MSIKLLFKKTIHSTACLVKNLMELFMEVLQYLLTIQLHTVTSNLILACGPSQSELLITEPFPYVPFISPLLQSLPAMILTIFSPSYLPLFYCSETSTLTVLYGVARKQMYEGSWSKTYYSSITFHY